MRLKNKVAIITGAAGGMGEVEAKIFAEEGASVLTTDIQEEKLKEWVSSAQEQGLAIEYIAHDVSSFESWQNVVQKAITTFGKIDILVNNAGVYPAGATTTNTDLSSWNKIMAINLTGPFIGSQACVPFMRSAGGGSIVNISSIAGLVGGNGPAYTASKGGLRMLTKDQAVEFAQYGIRVNSIHPGGVLTSMTQPLMTAENAADIIKNMCPMGRMGNAAEIAYGALYLASDEASYVTGAELVIDGGLVAR